MGKWLLSSYRNKLLKSSLILIATLALGSPHAARAADPGAVSVPRAVCGAGDHPETALQGQVPAPLRAQGFRGFNCNLQLVGQSRNDGGNWQSAEFKDKGLTCGYYGSAAPATSPTSRDPATYGTRVVDLTDKSHPTLTGYLTTPAMLNPWESVKTNAARKLLVSAQFGGPVVDVYDLSVDCRYPQLLASAAIGTGTDGGPVTTAPVVGHEGVFSPDGLTYYHGDPALHQYHAIDLTDPRHPKHITSFDMSGLGAGLSHGLSVSDDAKRLYVTDGAIAINVLDPRVQTRNGFAVLDVSQVQARIQNPTIKLVSLTTFANGGWPQHQIPVSIKGKKYAIHVEEGGGGGLPGLTALSNWTTTCQAGVTPFGTARIVDISDETHPQLVSKLILEVNHPKSCALVAPDLVGLSVFSYGTHYCSVDNRSEATTLACGEFSSGIRVFDIRDPSQPKEIAYYNPAGVTTPSGGSSHAQFGAGNAVLGGPDWCTAQLHLNADDGTLWTTCQDNGLLVLKFTNGVWPFPESRTPPDQQN